MFSPPNMDNPFICEFDSNNKLKLVEADEDTFGVGILVKNAKCFLGN